MGNFRVVLQPCLKLLQTALQVGKNRSFLKLLLLATNNPTNLFEFNITEVSLRDFMYIHIMVLDYKLCCPITSKLYISRIPSIALFAYLHIYVTHEMNMDPIFAGWRRYWDNLPTRLWKCDRRSNYWWAYKKTQVKTSTQNKIAS